MPPIAKRNRCVILYDLNCKNQKNLRQALLKVYTKYHFHHSKDVVSLVLVNSTETHNRKYKAGRDQYKHIKEIGTELPFDPPSIVYTHIEADKAEEAANWKEALRVAIQILKDDDVSRVITYQILYLTDLTCSSPSDENLRGLKSELMSKNIYLYIVGPEVVLPRTITTLRGMQTIMSDITFVEPNDNLLNAKKLVTGPCVIISNVKHGLQLFFNYKRPMGKQAWTVPISIGTQIKIHVCTARYVQKYRGLRLVNKKSKQYKKYLFASAADTSKRYSPEQVRKGISRHGKFIPIQDNSMFKTMTERTFSLLFVTRIDSIPEYMMKGPGCYTVSEDPKMRPHAFRCLVTRLHHNGSCLIMKRVYNRGNRATYLALLPRLSGVFRAIQLAYDTDIPMVAKKEQDPKKDKTPDGEVGEYLRSITVDSVHCLLKLPMTNNIVCNSKEAKIFNKATDKLLRENLHLEQIDHDVFATGITADIGKSLRDIWPSRDPITKSAEPRNVDVDSDYDDYTHYF